MYTALHCNLHELLPVQRLLIADITPHQPFQGNFKNMPEEMKKLISYNTWDDGVTQDTFEIEHWHLMMANRFMAVQNIMLDC